MPCLTLQRHLNNDSLSYLIRFNLNNDILRISNFCLVELLRTAKSSLNLVNLNQIWIVITLFRLILHKTEFILVPNKMETGKYNLISVDLRRIRSRILFLYEFFSCGSYILKLVFLILENWKISPAHLKFTKEKFLN